MRITFWYVKMIVLSFMTLMAIPINMVIMVVITTTDMPNLLKFGFNVVMVLNIIGCCFFLDWLFDRTEPE